MHKSAFVNACLTLAACLREVRVMMGSGRIASRITVLISVHRWIRWRGEQMRTLSGLRRVQKASVLCETGNDQQCCCSTGRFISFLRSAPATSRWWSPWFLWLDHWVHILALSPHLGSLTVGLVLQCQTIHGRDRNCTPPQLPPEWITTLLFIILGIVSLTVSCGLMVMSRWRCEASRHARWIAFVGSMCPHSPALIWAPARL